MNTLEIKLPKTAPHTEYGSCFEVKDYSAGVLELMSAIVIGDAKKTLGPGKVYELRAKLVGFKSDFGRGPVDDKYGLAWYRTEDDDGSPILDQYPIFGPTTFLPYDHPGGYYLLGRLVT